jgi:2,5-diamino-6-(ribosylamino)-4(3H)-pyrimidinone 5'-phosphate reductase
MISSVDGKISSGDTDQVDVDQDWKTLAGVKEGLSQYYALEKTTDYYSFNTGRVMAKIGVNTRTGVPKKVPVRFVLVDNKPHLNERGLQYLSAWVEHIFIVTTNKKHPAFKLADELGNITVIYYPDEISFPDLFVGLKENYGVKKMTIQSGGTMNAELLRAGLIDRLSLVVAPLLVGGKTTPSLIDGEAVHSIKELSKLRPLKLIGVKKLKHSYLHLIYNVL